MCRPAGAAELHLAVAAPVPDSINFDAVAHTDKNVRLSPIEFFYQQMKVELILSPDRSRYRRGGAAMVAQGTSVAVCRDHLPGVPGDDDSHACQELLCADLSSAVAVGAVALGEISRRKMADDCLCGISCEVLCTATGHVVLTVCLRPSTTHLRTAGMQAKCFYKFTGPLPQIL